MAGNARFHNKWHRRNHHSEPSIGYPDSANDPIASPSEPFRGDFHLTGTLSAGNDLFVGGNATINKNLSVFGDNTYLDTIVTVTSALSVINYGKGPALTVAQYDNYGFGGPQDIARFASPDRGYDALFIDKDANVIVDGSVPGQKYSPYVNSVTGMNFTVYGNSYSTKGAIWERPDGNTVYVSQTGSDLNSGLNPSQKVRTIKKACQIVFNTYGTNKATIQVEAGDYTEKNPIYVPAGTSIIGEAFLRRTIIRPYNRQMDVFWLNNGCYVWGFTFRDTLEPCASTAFPNLLSGTPAYKVAFQTPGCEIDVKKPGGPFGLPIVSKPFIVTSPYTQGMSTITTFLKVPIQPDLFPSYVTPGQQYTDNCLNDGYLASSKIAYSFDIVANAIENVTTIPAITSSIDPVPGANDAITLINSNSAFIQDAVINFVDKNYPLLPYNKTSCRRDVGYILQSVVYDLTNNTNLSSVSAARYYYGNSGQSLVNGQQVQTAEAIRYANKLTQDIIINKVHPWYSQRYDLTQSQAVSAVAAIGKSLDVIAGIVRTGVLPLSTTNPVPSPAVAAQASYLLNLNKPFIQKTTIQYVNKTFPGFTYNRELCERDAGFMIDAVIFDITNNTTASAIKAGSFYYVNGSSIIRGQEIQTAAAISFIKFLAQKVVANTLAVTGQSFNPYLSSGYLAEDFVKDSFDTVKRIIVTGEKPKNQFIDIAYDGSFAFNFVQEFFSTITSIITSKGTVPSPVSYGSIIGGSAAAFLLSQNKEFIQRLTLDYVKRTYPTLTFNKTLCYRDVGYIVDAVVSDLTTATNLSSIYAGQMYYSGITTYQTFDFFYSSGYSATSAVKTSFYTIIDTIKNYGNVPDLVFYTPTPGFADAVQLLQYNKPFIQELTVKYVNKNYPYFYYDREKCYRDVGYVVDAVMHDLTYYTNESARWVASSYYYACASQIQGQENPTAKALEYAYKIAAKVIVNQQFPMPTNIEGQEGPTADAIQYAASVATYIITNSAYPFYKQSYNLLNPGTNSAPAINTGIIAISGIVDNGVGSVSPSPFVPPVDADNARNLLQDNKDFLKVEMVKYINKRYPSLVYEKQSYFNTKRFVDDIGNIIDVLGTDINNGNYNNTVAAAETFYTGYGQIIDTFTYPNGIQAYSAIQTSLFTISETIRQNGATQSAQTYGILPGFAQASALITLNKAFIQRLTVDYIDRTFTGLGKTFSYDREKCYRDVGFILDAVITDLAAGNNDASLYAAASYYNGTQSLIVGQETQTAAAIDYIFNVTSAVIDNVRYPGTSIIPDEKAEFSFNLPYLSRIAKQVISNQPVSSRYDAATLLSLNKAFIQKEVIQYVNRVYPSFVYNRDKCERDVGYIIDAVIYDVTNGTTLSAIQAGNYYYNGVISLIPNQEIETAMAVDYAKYLALQVIKNEPVRTIGGGTGIRVDGELALGFLRSFVTDSFTQYNQGGKGIHIINCGYAQLVSTFTICTTEGVMTEAGGQCSISTSNCSFGLSGLVAVGKSKFPVLTGYQSDTTPLAENFIIVRGVTPKPLSAFIDAIQRGNELEGIPIESPYNGLLARVKGDPASEVSLELNPDGLTKYHGIRAVSALPADEYGPYAYRLTLESNTTAPLTASSMEPKYVEMFLRSQIASSSHAFEYIGTGVELELAVPALGGRPINTNEAVFADNGIVYYSSTNERGDFKVGNGFTIVQEKGSIEGLAFNKSILALVTPLILSLS